MKLPKYKRTKRSGGSRIIFTEEVLAAIPGWVESGATREMLAEALGTTVASLEATCSKHGISLKAAGKVDAVLRRTLSSKVWAALEDEASARNITVSDLIVQLLEVVARDDLFTAVLDTDD